jgi:23S rRNA G2445 N2-methylase RlmL
MKTDKELYRQLRTLSCEKLWKEEVARFDRADPKGRLERVAVIRAVGVVFSASGTAEQRAEVKAWLARLLQDPAEKIRRYAMAAIPKIGAGRREESELLSLLKTTTGDREKKYLGRALDKIGGPATLEAVAGAKGLLPQTEQKVKASIERRQRPSTVRMDRVLSNPAGLRIHLRCRRGLEGIVRDEFVERMGPKGKFRGEEVRSGLVAIVPVEPFSLADIYTLRCFGTVNFVLGTVRGGTPEETTEALARAITSPLSRLLLSTFTEGSLRYRLDFISKSHQRGAVRLLANRAYALCPDILNDARLAPWSVDIREAGRGLAVELRPRLAPDPRYYYREDDVAAASHPPLAACMARLAGKMKDEIAWDPFCGSGQELVERALLGGVRCVYGTDISPEAIAIAQTNFAAAKVKNVQSKFACCDFRDFGKVAGFGPESVTLVITNPPMGRRVRIPDMRGLFADFFGVAAAALKPGGRLVFANPLRLEPRDPSLKLQSRQIVDLGGFDCRLELYLKTASRK